MYHFLHSISQLPAVPHSEEVKRGISRLQGAFSIMEDPAEQHRAMTVLAQKQGSALLSFIFSYSPFLSRLVLQHPHLFLRWCEVGSSVLFDELMSEVENHSPAGSADLMKVLRVAKGKVSLIIALGDLTNTWSLERVTASMSEFAELTVQKALQFLLLQAHHKQELQLLTPDKPEQECSLFVLAMGKMGAKELNYSSDIDLIALFETAKARHIGIENPQQFFPKLTREFVRLLQERTADGYVFRVDLRLRPDPASTPVALSTAGAITYYETVGQNWERAALIKARPVGGDMELGFQFLKQIAPFIWRKHLDFAAIADIQSIKRQMDARTGSTIALEGHNIKTGLGGIREIEFLAQIHQLIWGGRLSQLRMSGTCRTLEALAECEIITVGIAAKLIENYRIFRMIEHRLQMIDDQQTHTMPQSKEACATLAAFAGYPSLTALEEDLLPRLNLVHTNFSTSFCGQGSLGNEGETLSFTGVENNPETVETIRKMGFSNAGSVSEVIQAWHRGARRATRTKRARELITELTPSLLKALAATTHPEQAFTNFDAFLARLPAGIQLFSLFQANPHLLQHIAIIMGSAPAMAESLSKTPALLDSILTADFFESFSTKPELFNELSNTLILCRDFEDEMDAVRRFKNEKQFQAGVQLLYRKVSAEETRHYLSDVAETCIEILLHRVEIDFIRKHPEIETGQLAIIALGRLGGRELTFGSDVDMVFLYHAQEDEQELAPHYNKLSKRFISSLTALTPQGKLYDVDTRLRPSGKDGAVVVNLRAFDKYFTEAAWTFERMALTRARVIAGSEPFRTQVADNILYHLLREKNKTQIAQDVLDIRARVEKEFGTQNPWNLKYARGGVMDMDFLAQYFVLCHAHTHPDIIHGCSGVVFQKIKSHALLPEADANILLDAYHFLNSLFTMLRLCGGGELDEVTAVPGLKAMIAGFMKMPHFGEVRIKLNATLSEVKRLFDLHVKP